MDRECGLRRWVLRRRTRLNSFEFFNSSWWNKHFLRMLSLLISYFFWESSLSAVSDKILAIKSWVIDFNLIEVSIFGEVLLYFLFRDRNPFLGYVIVLWKEGLCLSQKRQRDISGAWVVKAVLDGICSFYWFCSRSLHWILGFPPANILGRCVFTASFRFERVTLVGVAFSTI